MPSPPNSAAGARVRGALRRPTQARTVTGLALHLLALLQGMVWLEAGDTWRGGLLVAVVLCSVVVLSRSVRLGVPASIPTQRAVSDPSRLDPSRLDPSGLDPSRLDRDLHDR